MATPPPSHGWPPKRIAALLLTLGLVAIGAYSVSQGIIGTLPVLAMGVVLGGMYVWRGTLPDRAYRIGRGRGGASITRDDDPANLPAKVYLRILLGVILVTAAWFFFGLRR